MARPKIEITDEHIGQIEKLSGFGLTVKQIAAVIGMSERTLRRKSDEPRVLAALEKGRAEAEIRVGEALFRKALRGNVSAIVWWEKTRAGRKETSVQEVTGKDGGSVAIEHNGRGYDLAADVRRLDDDIARQRAKRAAAEEGAA